MEKTLAFGRIRRTAAILERAVPWLALGAAVVGLFLLFRTQREAISGLDWNIPWQVAVLSATAFALAPLVQGLSFWLALRLLTGSTPVGDAMVVWSRSYVVRYAPTGALAIAYRVAARRRLHASAEQVLAAYAYEHVATLGAAAAACIVLFAIAGSLPPLPALGIAVAALVLTAALRPGAAGRVLDAIARRLGIHLSAVLPGRQLAALVALNALGWLGTGAGVYLLVDASAGDAPGFLWLVGSYTAGYLVGFVAPLAPGGLGAREGMLVVLLRGRYGTADAIGVSLAIRVVNVAGELLAVAVIHVAYGAAAALRRARTVRAAPAAAAVGAAP
jgi:glycosyltransferase 2 family protein